MNHSNDLVGVCSKCGVKQRLGKKMNKAARAILQDTSPKKFSLFSEEIDRVCAISKEDEDEIDVDIETKLLCSNCKQYTINPRSDVVIRVDDLPQV